MRKGQYHSPIDPGQARLYVLVCQEGPADGILVLRRTLDLLVDRFLERNIP